MAFLVMYDIQDNDMRTSVFKYLKRIGCHNIQKSIFIGSASHQKYQDMRSSLKETLEVTGNTDSVIVVPLYEDTLSSMELYGREYDLELLLGRKNTVFL